MNRRVFILTATLASLAGPAWAEDGGGSGSDTSGERDGGSGDGGASHDVGGDGGGDSTRSGGAGGEQGESGASGNSAANAALNRGDVLPLGRMLEIFRGYGQLTIVDVRLVERKQTLVYAFKFIDAQGSVRRAYFDAHTGAMEG